MVKATLAGAVMLVSVCVPPCHAQGITFPDQNGDVYYVSPNNQEQILNWYTGAVAATLPAPIAGPLVLARDGVLYGGTAAYDQNEGTIFSLSSTGTVKTVYSFSGPDGANPSMLTLGDDGNLYGQTYDGGASDAGTIFVLSSSGLTTLYNFSNTVDGRPSGPNLIQFDSDHFFGVSTTGMFEVSKSGTLVPGIASTYGNPLTLGPNGTFYVPDFYEISSTGNVTALQSISETFSNSGQSCYSNTTQYLYGAGGTLYIGGACAGGGMISGSLFEYIPSGNPRWIYDGPSDPNGVCNAPTIGYGLNSTIVGFYEDCEYPTPQIGQFSTYVGGFPFTSSAYAVTPGTPFTLNWASSLPGPNAQQCSAFGAWSGLQPSTGTATFTLSTPGTYNYLLVCEGFYAANVTVTVTGATTTTLSVSPNPIASGKTVSLTAAVSLQGGGPVTTGNAVFNLASYGKVSVPVNSSGTATLTESTAGVPPGTYKISAMYQGSGEYGSSSASTSIQVVSAGVTTTTLTATSPVCTGKNELLQVSVTTTGGTKPNGTATIYANGVKVTAFPVTNGQGYLSIPSTGFPAGVYQLKAAYSGDSLNNASTSSPIAVSLNPPADVTLSASPNPVPADGTVTLSAGVSAAGGPATGSVAFYFNGTLLGLSTLKDSVATLQQPVSGNSAGVYPVIATFEGNSTQCSGTSPTVNVTVQ